MEVKQLTSLFYIYDVSTSEKICYHGHFLIVRITNLRRLQYIYSKQMGNIVFYHQSYIENTPIYHFLIEG